MGIRTVGQGSKETSIWNSCCVAKARYFHVVEIITKGILSLPSVFSSTNVKWCLKVGLYSRGSSEYKIFCSGLDGAGRCRFPLLPKTKILIQAKQHYCTSCNPIHQDTPSQVRHPFIFPSSDM